MLSLSISLRMFILWMLVVSLTAAGLKQKSWVKIYPAPKKEPLSASWKVSVQNQSVPVYMAKVAAADPQSRWKSMDDPKNSAMYYDSASFAYFDMKGNVKVLITVPSVIETVKILPVSAGIKPVIKGKSLRFNINTPQNLTIEINGAFVQSLHLFANPPETDIPRADDPDVVFFGPGIHEVSSMVIGDNKTVYVSGGAIVRAVIHPDEKFSINPRSGLRGYAPTFQLRGKNIKFRGRGIVDASGCPTHARNMIYVKGSNVSLEGVILRDASLWTVPIRQSDSVVVDNLKLLGYRANSDGIDICNSRDVLVENCFIRTLDDLVVIKADKNQGEVKRIRVRKCILWNQVAHALSIGAEVRDNIDDVIFSDSDIIHDQGREWSMRIFQSDAGRISNVLFESIRVEEAKKCISLWIGKSVWSRDEDRGHISGVTFRNITAAGSPLTVQLVGYDKEHNIDKVQFDKVILNGKKLTKEHLKVNEFVKGVEVGY